MVEALLFQEVAVIDEDLGVPEECPRLVVGECVDVPGDQSSELIGMLLFKTSQDLGVVEFSRPKDNPKRPFPTALISPIEVPHLRLSPSASHPQSWFGRLGRA
jgi:hypothetical protein